MSWTLLFIIAMIAPLGCMVALYAVPQNSGCGRLADRVSAWASLPALIFALGAPLGWEWQITGLLLGAHFRFDVVSQTFLFLTAALWLLAGLFTHYYFSYGPSARRFKLFFLITMLGNLGVTVAYDVASFYLFFVMMSFAAYGLIVHHRDGASKRAGLVYMVMVVASEIFLFAAFLMIAAVTFQVSLDNVAATIAASQTKYFIVSFVLIGFGIKAGSWFLHFWLPLAHPAAPVPASAVLSGAIIKAGLIGWLRFLPLGIEPMPVVAGVLVICGLLAAFLGALIGLAQDEPKTILAYSSISQMGVITIGFGLMLATAVPWQQGFPAVSIYVTHHGFAKAALFLGVGLLPLCRNRWHGCVVWFGLSVAALSLAGAPLSSGAFAKGHLANGIATLPWPDVASSLSRFLTLSSVTTTLLMARFLFVTWTTRECGSESRSLNMLLVVWALALVAVLGASFYVAAEARVGSLESWLSLESFISATGPLSLGALISALVLYCYKSHGQVIAFRVPPGDMLVVFEYLHRKLARAVYLIQTSWNMVYRPGRKERWFVRHALTVSRRLAALEGWLRRWRVALTLFAGVYLIFVWLSMP